MNLVRAAGPAFMAVAVSGWWLVGSCADSSEPENVDGIVQTVRSADQLVSGVEATGRIGDFVLDNGRARFVVQAPGSSTGWGLYGGAIVDVAVPGQASDDRLEEIFVQCDLRGFRPTSAEVVQPGSETEAGILRLVGADAGLPYLDAILPRDPLEIRLTVDYVLPPDGTTLEIRISAKDERKREKRELSCGLMLLAGDEYRLFSSAGFADDVGGSNPFLAAAAAKVPVSYLLHRPDAPVNVVIGALPFLPIGEPPVPFLANATIEATYRLTLGPAGDVESALASANLAPPADARRAVDFTFTGPELTGRALIATFTDPSRPESQRGITSARADADGVVRARLPAGMTQVAVEVDGRPVEAFTVEVPAGTEPWSTSHEIRSLGAVRVQTTESGLDGAVLGPTPARIRVAAGHGAAPTAGALYEAYAGAEHRFFMPEGQYTVIVSRGPEHELSLTDVDVTVGGTAEVSAQVARVVDRAGWVSADLHVHGTRSSDSETPKRVRVLGAIAEGLDVLVATDHDAVTDYAPQLAELGMQERLRTVSGTEMSMLYGHINGFPVAATQPEDHWRPGWFEYGDDGRFIGVLEPVEVVAALRAAGAKVVQVNHPRSDQGVFDYVDLDPETGLSERTWPEPDAIELLNGKRIDEYDLVLPDFHALAKRGRRVTATGSSDVHSDFGVGYARTYVRVPAAGALAELDLEQVWQGILQGRAVAASGPFVELTARRGGEAKEIGEVLTGAGPVTLEVRVQAPSWMRPEQIRLFEADQVLATRTIAAEDADPERPALRFAGTFTATVTRDTYYMVEVTGADGQPYLRQQITTTNPVWVDAEGDGLSLGD